MIEACTLLSDIVLVGFVLFYTSQRSYTQSILVGARMGWRDRAGALSGALCYDCLLQPITAHSNFSFVLRLTELLIS